MRLSAILRSLFCAALVLSFASVSFAQEGGGGGRGGRGGPGGGFGGGFGGFGQRTNELTNALEVLGDLNLSPDFTLDKDQKTKIKSVREEYTKAMDKWRQDNEQKLSAIREEMQNAQDREARQAIMTKSRELYATAPKADDSINAVKAALTADQKSAFEKALAERAERRGGPGGGRGGEGGGRRRGADL
jgi:Spy/CpxP family protein refolding chaperone